MCSNCNEPKRQMRQEDVEKSIKEKGDSYEKEMKGDMKAYNRLMIISLMLQARIYLGYKPVGWKRQSFRNGRLAPIITPIFSEKELKELKEDCINHHVFGLEVFTAEEWQDELLNIAFADF